MHQVDDVEMGLSQDRNDGRECECENCEWTLWEVRNTWFGRGHSEDKEISERIAATMAAFHVRS